MREQEMRECVGHFLKTRMRAMLLPATLGLGLAVAGCDKEALETTDDSGTNSQVEAGVIQPDTKIEPPIVAKYIAQLPDATVAPEYMAPMPDGGAVALYMAPMPDAKAKDAQSPDAGMVLRYMAPLPTPGQPVMLYMAQYPDT